jgi:hypothetical protein
MMIYFLYKINFFTADVGAAFPQGMQINADVGAAFPQGTQMKDVLPNPPAIRYLSCNNNALR